MVLLVTLVDFIRLSRARWLALLGLTLVGGAFAFAYAASCGSDLHAMLIGADSEQSPGEDAIRQLAICYPSVTLRTSVLPSWGGVADEVAGSQLVVVGSWTDRQGRHRIDHGFLVAQAMADVDSPVALIAHEPAA